MRIAILTYDLSFGGGGERVAVNMANYFTTHLGHNLTIVSTGNTAVVSPFEIEDKVLQVYFNVPAYCDSKYLSFVHKIRIIPKLKNYFSVNKFDAIISVGTLSNVLYFLCGLQRSLNIATEHSSYNNVNVMWKIIRKLTYWKFTALVSLTEHDRYKLMRLNKNVFVIPNSSTFQHIQDKANMDSKKILSVGRFEKGKGYDMLIEVFDLFHKQNKEWKLKIIGDGYLKEQIAHVIDGKGLSEWVEIAHPTTNILQEYLNASIFIMTSRAEGLPMVLIEAQSCGMPLIAFNCQTGPSDIIINGRNGYLIECYDIEKMAEKLRCLSQSPQVIAQFSSNAKKDSARFSDETIYSLWENLFNSFKNKI